MNLTFCGADLEVTGSCHLLEHDGKKYLIDCGLFQTSHFIDKRNYEPFPFDPAEIEAVIITHAHLDHVGRLPKLTREGFKGKIYANLATVDLTRLMLLDAVEIMRYNQKKYGDQMLFDENNVKSVGRQMVGLDYDKKRRLSEDLFFTLRDAGHILGSAWVEIEGAGKKIVFSGDIGNSHVPIVCETRALGAIDYLVMESTYGNRNHESVENRIYLLQNAIIRAVLRGGVLMIPAFSLERTQELLYEINNLLENNLIPSVPIFLDSPLAADATDVYKKYSRYFDEAAQYLVSRGDDLFRFPQLKITRSSEESKTINAVPPPKIIIAGSGMMNGGRIQHHLLRYLPDSKNMLLIVAYQAGNTLGRQLLQKEKRVKIYGQEIQVKAEIKAIGAYSAHGDQNKIMEWVKGAKKVPEKIFLTHGEKESMKALEKRLKKETGAKVVLPDFGMKIEL
ncbi:MAG: MBL fold metallo-hydrolase [Patescibacteria group bacterium]